MALICIRSEIPPFQFEEDNQFIVYMEHYERYIKQPKIYTGHYEGKIK